jgi:hypothetical protein
MQQPCASCATLRQKIHAQAHALAQLNKAVTFAFNLLEAPLTPLTPKRLGREARKGKL